MSTEDSENYAHLEKNHFPRWKCLLQTQDSQRKAQWWGHLCRMVLDPWLSAATLGQAPCYLPWCCKRETKVPEDLVPFSATTFRPIPMQAFQGALTSYFLPSLRWPQGTVWRERCMAPSYTKAFQGNCWHFLHPVSPGTTSNFLKHFQSLICKKD